MVIAFRIFFAAQYTEENEAAEDGGPGVYQGGYKEMPSILADQ